MPSPAISQLALNLSWGTHALKYVEKRMTIGAGNRLWDLLTSLGGSLGCVAGMRQVSSEISEKDVGIYLDRLALIAEATGCGNCGEHAAVAFRYLKGKKISPIDYTVYESPGDHAFVVIGRDADSKIDDYKTWGPNAVICDTWDHKVFAATLIPQELHKGWEYGFQSWHRI